jgi:pimeloyl-ACP methyl ester carboxylesterase
MGSLSDDVLAVLEASGVVRASVVGLSMGGYLAFELHRRRPDLFRSLVLCDTRAGADTPQAAAGRETFAAHALERGLGWVADEMLPKLLRPSPDPAVVATVRRLIAQGTAAGVAAAQRGMATRPDSTPSLRAIRCPTLVVVGAQDTLTVPAESRALAAAIRGSRLVEIPDAGHLSNLENAGAFRAALLGFLDAARA